MGLKSEKKVRTIILGEIKTSIFYVILVKSNFIAYIVMKLFLDKFLFVIF